MNEYDRTNLSFLLNSSPEVIEEWYYSVGRDDREYASELLKTYREELNLKETLLQDYNIINMFQSGDVLNKFKIGKK